MAMTYKWILRPLAQPSIIAEIRRKLNNLPEALARALVLRGVDSFDHARLFFRPTLTALHDPLLMADMAPAAGRVARAIQRGERILIHGDYDVDGTTATALLVSALRGLGGDVEFFIPDRFKHGYGLGPAGIEHAAGLGTNLIVAVDCGVTSIGEAEYARGKGIDLIVCDHHTPGPQLPDCVAVIDPKRSDCAYPFGELCGCAVAYKLLQAVLGHLGRAPEDANEYLDLVAVATASDVVPVHGENRVLLAYGLRALQATPRLGFRKLAESARLDLAGCAARDIAYGLGPRINAAGRLGDAGRAVALLLEQDESAAEQLATELEQLNVERRSLDKNTYNEAVELAERQLTSRTRHSIVLHKADWHLGVIGIVASRLVERFHRPTILLSTSNGYAKGSARSVPGINIYDALHECSDLLVQFGGHDGAAGMTLRIDDIQIFQNRLDDAVGNAVTPEVLLPSINVDSEVHLDDIDARFWAVLKQFAPFGPENDPPIFRADAVHLSRKPKTVGTSGKHLKLSVRRDDTGSPLDAIGFGMGDRSKLLEESWCSGTPVDMLFCLEENSWRGRKSLQLNLKDIRLSTSTPCPPIKQLDAPLASDHVVS